MRKFSDFFFSAPYSVRKIRPSSMLDIGTADKNCAVLELENVLESVKTEKGGNISEIWSGFTVRCTGKLRDRYRRASLSAMFNVESLLFSSYTSGSIENPPYCP